MFTTSDKPRTQAQLCHHAELKIQGGIAPDTKGWTIGTSTLTLLHSLASDPATAGDALKLLHELQVHQVELDLQHEHMEDNRRGLEESVQRYAELYDFAPVAYFTVDSTDRIVDGNLAAARMLGVERDDLAGRSIASLVSPAGRLQMLELLEQVSRNGLRQVCNFRAGDGVAGSVWLQVLTSALPRRPLCLVIVTDLSDAEKCDPTT